MKKYRIKELNGKFTLQEIKKKWIRRLYTNSLFVKAVSIAEFDNMESAKEYAKMLITPRVKNKPIYHNI